MSRNLRIAFLHYRFKPNPDYVDLAQKLRDRGHLVWFGSRNDQNDLSWFDGDEVVAVIRGQKRAPQMIRKWPILPGLWNRLAYLSFIRRIRHFLRESQIEVIQTLPPPYWPQLFPLFMRSNTKFILAIKQMNLGVGTGIVHKIKDWMLIASRGMSARYFYDHTVFDYYLTAKALLGQRWQEWATAIPLGLNPELFERVVPPPDPESPNRVRFLYVGTISKFRKLETVLQAAKIAAATNDNFIIDIIGPDQTDGFYHDLIEELEVGQVVRILPPVPYETIPELMTTYHVGLAYTPDYLTWHYQPTIKILEYRAVGLPILSTDVTAHRDIVEDGVNGVLVKDEVNSVGRGILRFVQDPAFLRKCYDHAQQCRDGLTAMQVAERHEQVYFKVLR